MQELKQRSIQAFKWTVIGQMTMQILALIINIVLVRFLGPQDFGLFAFPYMVYMFFRLIHDFGYSEVLIKEKDAEHKLASSIFWLMVISGFLLSLLMYFCSPLIAIWSSSPSTVTMIKWLSLAVLIGSVFSGYDAVMRKMLLFKQAFFVDFVSNIVSSCIGIYLAYHGFMWKALLARVIFQILIAAILSAALSGFKPLRVFDISMIKKQFIFARSNIFEQALAFMHKNIDTLLISRYIGSYALGIYDRSFKFLSFPIQQVSASFSKVMLPAFSQIKDEKERVRQIFLKICRLTSLVTFPMMLGLFVSCNEFVLVVFGQKWMEMVPILRWFSILSIFQSITAIGNNVFYITDNAQKLLKFALVSRPIFILAIVAAIFIHKDIYYVALYGTIAALFFILPFLRLTAACLGMSPSKILDAIMPQLLAAMAMMIAMAVAKSFLHLTKDCVNLIITSMVGMTSYIIILILSKNRAFNEAKALIVDGD